MLRLLDTGSPLSSPTKTAKIPIGNYTRFMFRFFGTNQDEKVMLISSVGQIQLVRNGQQVRNLPFDFIHTRSNLHNGYAKTESTEDSSYAFSAWLDMGIKGIPNSFDVRSNTEAYFRFNFDTTDPGIASATTCAASSWELYGEESDSIAETYCLYEYTHNITAGGAAMLTEVLEGKNIGVLYFSDSGSVVTNLNVQRDKQVVFDGDDAALVEYTNMLNQVESALAIAEIPFVRSDLSEAINDEIIVRPTFSGAGTLYVYVSEVVFDGSNAEASIANAQNKARSRLAKASKVTQAKVSVLSPLLRVNPSRMAMMQSSK